MKRAIILTALLLMLPRCAFHEASRVEISGNLSVWHPITLSIQGPQASEQGEVNPFLDYRLVVTFTHQESGHELHVPGYFAADGNAADTGAVSGAVWRVHFVPDAEGSWQYTTSFHGGDRIALSAVSTEGSPVEGDRLSGTFIVRAPAPGSPAARGRLRHQQGARYLQYSGDGGYFLKSGADSPENFLAYVDFDADSYSEKALGPEREGEAPEAPRHRYETHIADWKANDPSWKEGKGKGIIGALNYLASKGVNSVYFLTMNIKGDGNDVWPYIHESERYRFDCSKLSQWNRVFNHMDRLGIMLHVVLTETENESLFEVEEGGNFAESRKLYYREMVARFSYHRAVTWNLGEENGWSDDGWDQGAPQKRANTDSQRKAFASYVSSLDPYGNPIVVHTLPGRYDEIYTPLLGYPAFDGPSLQIADIRDVHGETLKWIDRSRAAQRPWFVSLDEIGPHHTGVMPDADDPNHDEVRHFALWGNLMAGGAGCEWYFGYRYAHNDLGLEDFRSRDRMWELTHIAVDFFHRFLPFPEMQSADDLLTNSNAYCFAKEGSIYAVYLPPGETTRIRLPESRFTIRWFDPRNGGEMQEGSVAETSGGDNSVLGSPPSDPESDWVVLLSPVG